MFLVAETLTSYVLRSTHRGVERVSPEIDRYEFVQIDVGSSIYIYIYSAPDKMELLCSVARVFNDSNSLVMQTASGGIDASFGASKIRGLVVT